MTYILLADKRHDECGNGDSEEINSQVLNKEHAENSKDKYEKRFFLAESRACASKVSFYDNIYDHQTKT